MGINSKALKSELLSNFLKARTPILHAASQLSSEAQDTIFLGTWSLKDLLAHLAGWDFTNLAAAKDIQAGKLPEFVGQRDRDWQSYNAALVAKYKRDDFEELLALVKDSHRQLIAYLESIPAEDFSKDFGVRDGSYRMMIDRLMRAEWKDEQVHLEQIRAFAANAEK
jgi:hypothetical protein